MRAGDYHREYRQHVFQNLLPQRSFDSDFSSVLPRCDPTKHPLRAHPYRDHSYRVPRYKENDSNVYRLANMRIPYVRDDPVTLSTYDYPQDNDFYYPPSRRKNLYRGVLQNHSKTPYQFDLGLYSSGYDSDTSLLKDNFDSYYYPQFDLNSSKSLSSFDLSYYSETSLLDFPYTYGSNDDISLSGRNYYLSDRLQPCRGRFLSSYPNYQHHRLKSSALPRISSPTMRYSRSIENVLSPDLDSEPVPYRYGRNRPPNLLHDDDIIFEDTFLCKNSIRLANPRRQHSYMDRYNQFEHTQSMNHLAENNRFKQKLLDSAMNLRNISYSNKYLPRYDDENSFSTAMIPYPASDTDYRDDSYSEREELRRNYKNYNSYGSNEDRMNHSHAVRITGDDYSSKSHELVPLSNKLQRYDSARVVSPVNQNYNTGVVSNYMKRSSSYLNQKKSLKKETRIPLLDDDDSSSQNEDGFVIDTEPGLCGCSDKKVSFCPCFPCLNGYCPRGYINSVGCCFVCICVILFVILSPLLHYLWPP